MTRFSRKLFAVTAASALSFSVLFGPAIAQNSAPGDSAISATVPAVRIDPNADVSLTIEKYEGDPVAPGSTDYGTPLPGVQFKIEKVQADLTTSRGVEAVSQLTAENAQVDTSFGTNGSITVTTGADGRIVVDKTTDASFTVGVYRVTELQHDSYTVAKPFLVQLPFTENNAWNYNQTVRPKNQKLEPNKQIDANDVTVGKDVTFTINVPIPAGAMDRLVVEDTLVNELNFVAGSPNITYRTSQAAPSTTAVDAGWFAPVAQDGKKLTWAATPAGLEGLAQLRQQNPELDVSIEFKATVTSIPADGKITNTAEVQYPNGGVVTTDQTDPNGGQDTPTSVTFGNLTVKKNSGSGNAEMAGAEFELYRCQPTGGNVNDTTDYSTDPGNYTDVTWELRGEKLSMNSDTNATIATKIVTVHDDDDTGVANGYNIPIATFAKDGANKFIHYCVLEVKAPEGFARNPEPQPVKINRTSRTMEVDVINYKDSILGQLPATGAFGIILFFLAGLALLARGMYTSFRDNRTTA